MIVRFTKEAKLEFLDAVTYEAECSLLFALSSSPFALCS